MRYSTEKEFSYFNNIESVPLIVKANGGSVTISSYDGVEFVTADTISADSVNELYVKGQSIKITPTGGATYSIGTGL